MSENSSSSTFTTIAPTTTVININASGMSQQPIMFLAHGVAAGELLLLHPAVLAISVLNLAVLASSRILHPNLRFILICQSVCIGVFEIHRIALVCQKFASADIYNPGHIAFIITARLSGFFRNLIPHVIIMERLAATLLYKNYENWQKPYFSICWFIPTAAFSLAHGFSLTQVWATSLFSLCSQTILVALTLLEIAIFGILGLFNWKKYDRIVAKATIKQHSLSEKYQLSENIRTSKQLTLAFFCHFLNNLTVFIVFIVNFYGLISAKEQKSVFNAFSIVLQSVMDLCIEITVITYHPLLKKRFLTLVRKFAFWRRVRVHIERIEEAPPAVGTGHNQRIQPRDIRGAPLIRHSSAEIHFQMLERDWN